MDFETKNQAPPEKSTELQPGAQTHCKCTVHIPAGGWEEIKRESVIEALHQTNGVQSAAAKLLKISPKAIHNYIHKRKIAIPKKRPYKRD
jgi:transcriptional regulator with GAF, ATPase, and Fis domain